MVRTPDPIKKAFIARVFQAVRAAGLEVVRTEIVPDGRIVIIHHPHVDLSGTLDADLDRELLEFEARHGEG